MITERRTSLRTVIAFTLYILLFIEICVVVCNILWCLQERSHGIRMYAMSMTYDSACLKHCEIRINNVTHKHNM